MTELQQNNDTLKCFVRLFVQLTDVTLKHLHELRSMPRSHGMRYNVCRSPEVNPCIVPVVDLNVLDLCGARSPLEKGF